jgi:hypothetical protein
VLALLLLHTGAPDASVPWGLRWSSSSSASTAAARELSTASARDLALRALKCSYGAGCRFAGHRYAPISFASRSVRVSWSGASLSYRAPASISRRPSGAVHIHQ